MKRKAIIISISGKNLSIKEKKLIKKERPWGLILFKRNISNFNQTKRLIENIRKSMKDKNFPILIDEEGGKVCRLSSFLKNTQFSQNFFGDMYHNNKKISASIYKYYIYSLCEIFKLLGININTVPVLDLLKKNTSSIIGRRAYSKNKTVIKALGKICIDSYKKNKIGTMMKHIPGHGSASSDSHLKLPIVNNTRKNLTKNDFSCFSNMNAQFAMTAHIKYSKLDNEFVATHSKIIIKEIIRKKIKFKGILVSDDISMKALKYDLIKNANYSLKAGCNLVLYCAGKIKETSKLLKAMPLIDNFTVKKTSEFYKFLS